MGVSWCGTPGGMGGGGHRRGGGGRGWAGPWVGLILSRSAPLLKASTVDEQAVSEWGRSMKRQVGKGAFH